MRWNPVAFRLTASVALTALLCGSVMPPPAAAQPAPPPLPAPADQQAPPEQNQPDPPERVGRVAAITGNASFHNPGDTAWSPASVNYPVSTGNTFWTEPAARLRLEISDSRIAMAGGTEFEVATLDAKGLQGVAARGETYLRLSELAPNEAWSVQTPRGLVKLNGAGRYDILVGTTQDPTLVTVLEGSVDIEGPNLSLHVVADQTASITGTDAFVGSIGPARRDAFLTEIVDAERPRQATRVPQAFAAQVAAMPGGSDLDDIGSWTDAPQYGEVWYPPVDPGWVPYRHGHWAYVAPWGWTWIDDAPWGFAPFHYGRWVEIGGRWAWTPGEVDPGYRRPVYAPALVAFIGLGAGVAIGAALAAGSVGWVPLGPREAYHPWYHASESYVRQVNITHVTNITNTVTTNNFINRGGATLVPAAAMVGSRPVASVAQPVSPQQFAAARPVFGQQPLRPAATTAGVTPAIARQLNLGQAAFAHAPGPVIRAQAAGPAMPPASVAPRPGEPPQTGLPRFETPAQRAAPPVPLHSAPPPGVEREHAAPPPRAEAPHFNAPPPAVEQERVAPQRREPERFSAPPPRPEPQHFAAPPPRIEPERAAPPREQPQRFAAPPPQPQHFAAPPPRPEPPHPAPARPAEREKRPGEP